MMHVLDLRREGASGRDCYAPARQGKHCSGFVLHCKPNIEPVGSNSAYAQPTEFRYNSRTTLGVGGLGARNLGNGLWPLQEIKQK